MENKWVLSAWAAAFVLVTFAFSMLAGASAVYQGVEPTLKQAQSS